MDFKIYYRSVVIRTASYWHKDRYANHLKSTDSWWANQNQFREKNLFFFQQMCWENWVYVYRGLKEAPYLTAWTKFNCTCIKKKSKSMAWSHQIIGRTLWDHSSRHRCRQTLLGKDPKSPNNKDKNRKYVKIIQRMKD